MHIHKHQSLIVHSQKADKTSEKCERVKIVKVKIEKQMLTFVKSRKMRKKITKITGVEMEMLTNKYSSPGEFACGGERVVTFFAHFTRSL